ncbi:MAG: hypothetical protein ABI947_11955 [Chloroflexota bacterium]
MNDSEFLTAFEQATLPHFPHQAHVRMAWLYLRAYGLDEGILKISTGVQHLATVAGAPGKYHETITLFWARMVNHAIAATPAITDFHQFVEAHPNLLDGKLIAQYYSTSLIQSDTARHVWTEPDLQPLP